MISPSIGQPAVPAVELGHAGGEKNGVYRELGVPVGVKVDHRDLRFLNSVGIGVGVALVPPVFAYDTRP